MGAYLWNSAADTNVAGDGDPDAGATLAQITAVGLTPGYSWSTTLAAGSPFTPSSGGATIGVLSPAALSGICPTNAPHCFTGGAATLTILPIAKSAASH